MKLTRLVGLIVLAVLAAATPASLAQDKEKTEAAELTSE
jgi:hypothetical protein